MQAATFPYYTFLLGERRGLFIRGPDGSAGIAGTRLLSERRTALKLDSILSRQFD